MILLETIFLNISAILNPLYYYIESHRDKHTCRLPYAMVKDFNELLVVWYFSRRSNPYRRRPQKIFHERLFCLTEEFVMNIYTACHWLLTNHALDQTQLIWEHTRQKNIERIMYFIRSSLPRLCYRYNIRGEFSCTQTFFHLDNIKSKHTP